MGVRSCLPDPQVFFWRLNFKMPGHIKLVKGAVDPDPTEFLLPSMDMKKADQAKPYDPKASVWIPNPKDGGYREGILEVGNINLEDPVNDSVVEVMKSTSSCELLVLLWADHPGQPTTSPKEEGKKKKKGGGKTVSSVYLVSLVDLMNTLYSCEPHFVRCLVPNNHKKPGDVEPPLIMHQLTCNGVLEGIRICMRGFPNRMQYPHFKLRYSCLGQAEIASSSDNKTATYALMDKNSFGRERYRLGHTLVFFRAGALAYLEELRDELVIKWVRKIQGEGQRHLRGRVFEKKRDQRELIKVGQRNFRRPERAGSR